MDCSGNYMDQYPGRYIYGESQITTLPPHWKKQLPELSGSKLKIFFKALKIYIFCKSF